MPLQLEPLKQHPPCKVGRLVADATPGDAETILSWLDDPAINHARLARSLKLSGMSVSENVVGTHRRGECSCVKD